MQIKIDESLRLELINEKHAAAIFNLVNNGRPYLNKWLPWVEFIITVDNIKDYIQNSLKRYSDNNGFDCSIVLNNDIIGVIGLHTIDHSNKITSLGYWLGESFQGHGIMIKACDALTNYCFNSLRLNRVEIKCTTENFKSQSIPEKFNFFKEGIIRQAVFLNGRFVDHFLYSKLKGEWHNAIH
jgi:ribosomal-protein-serine acetyltransferase